MSDLLSAALTESGLDEFLRAETPQSILATPSPSISDGYIDGIDYYETEEIVTTQPEKYSDYQQESSPPPPPQQVPIKLRPVNSTGFSRFVDQYYSPQQQQQTPQSHLRHAPQISNHRIVQVTPNGNGISRPISSHQLSSNVRFLHHSAKIRVGAAQKFLRQHQNQVNTHTSPGSTHTRIIQVPAGYRLVSASVSSTPLSRQDHLVHQPNGGSYGTSSLNTVRHLQRIPSSNTRFVTTGTPQPVHRHSITNTGRGGAHVGSNMRTGYYPASMKIRPVQSNGVSTNYNSANHLTTKIVYRQGAPVYTSPAQQPGILSNQRMSMSARVPQSRIVSSMSPQLLASCSPRAVSPERPPSVPPPELQPQSPVHSPPTQQSQPIQMLHQQTVLPASEASPPSQNFRPKTTFVSTEAVPSKRTVMAAETNGRNSVLTNPAPQMDEKDSQMKMAEEDEIEQIQVDTYVEYFPPKLRSGLSHPDSVVETVSLSSVSSPEIRYHMSIPEEVVDMGQISALQLEAALYACQAHQKRLPSTERLGYLIGDGAGVGKGRIIATIIYENYLLGRKRAVWLSVSSDLKYDAERDLTDIGASFIEVHSLNKLKYAKINGHENGYIKKGVIFSTYASLIGECRSAQNVTYSSRLKQVLQWCGKDFDGVIVFDECHRAKNLCPSSGTKSTKTGKFVLELQRALPSARIVYASATGATEPRNMAYMTRLGLWGQGQTFETFNDFIHAVENRGVGAMEMVAMDMKLRGLYLARQLSFKGVGFRVEEVELTTDFIRMYDESVKVWTECRRQFARALSHMPEEMSKNQKVWAQFWSAHQRFFKYLCISAKVETCVKIALEAIAQGKCVVIGLQSTGEAQMLDYIEDNGEVTEFVSTAKAVLQGLIERHFPSYDDNRISAMDDFERMFLSMDDVGNGNGKKRKRCGDAISRLNKRARRRAPSLESDKLSAERESGGNSDIENVFDLNTDGDEDEDDEYDEEDDDEGEDDDEDEDEYDEVSDDAEEENDGKGNDAEDLVNAMMAELSSDDDSDENSRQDTDQRIKKEITEPTSFSQSIGSNICMSNGEINPFCMDLTREDPWAMSQKTLDESLNGKLNINPIDTLLRNKKAKRKIKKAKRMKKRIKASASVFSQTSAAEFISSTKLIGNSQTSADGSINLTEIKTDLLAAVENLSKLLPSNTLDQLINHLGGPNYVAEMTGRRGRVITKEDTGRVQYELRNADSDAPVECMNMEEKEKFMNGEKLVAIISEAASSGISLQSDRRANNRRRRVHITLELPWSADKAIQQFGRTHRSNQVSAPEYLFLISELAGEKRFASIVAKRLESLGALTHGDRRATETRDLSQFNIDTKYGREALEILFKTIVGAMIPIISPPASYKAGDFFVDMRVYMEGVGLLCKTAQSTYAIEREAVFIPKFLNRLLGLPVYAQNSLFQYFSDIVAELIKQAKFDGTYDMGIMDIGVGSDRVQKTETRKFVGSVSTNDFHVEMHKISLHRGVTWDEALSLLKVHQGPKDSFYISTIGFKKKISVALIYGIGKTYDGTNHRFYAITRPNTGRSPKFETFEEILQRFRPLSIDDAKPFWEEQYEKLDQQCHHRFYHGKCNNELAGRFCEVGRRTRTYFVLSGSVICVWPALEEILAEGKNSKNKRMQIVRVRTDNNQRVIGLLVLPIHVRKLVELLEQRCKP